MKNLSEYENITNDKNLLVLTYINNDIGYSTYLYLFKMNDTDNNSNLTYHYTIQNYAYTKSNKLSIYIEEASEKITAFMEILYQKKSLVMNNLL